MGFRTIYPDVEAYTLMSDDLPKLSPQMSPIAFIKAIEKRRGTWTGDYVVDLQVIYSYLFGALAINSGRNTYPTYIDLKVAIEAIQYLKCTIQKALLDTLSIDGLLVTLEAFGLTTAAFVALGAAGIVMLHWRLNTFRNVYPQMKTFFSSARQKHQVFNFFEKLQFSALNVDSADVASLTLQGMHAEAVQNLSVYESSWSNWGKEVLKLNAGYAKWAPVPAFVGFSAGLTQMFLTRFKCWPYDVVVRTCSALDHLNTTATEVYPWAYVSVGLAVTYCTALGVFSLSPHSKVFASVGDAFYNNFHQPYITKLSLRGKEDLEFNKKDSAFNEDDERWWLYPNLFWNYLFLPLLMGSVAYAFYSSFNTANQYEDAIGCPHLPSLNQDFWTFSSNSDPACNVTQTVVGLLGFIGDFEIGKLYLMYLLAKYLSYALGALAERYCNIEDKIPVDVAMKRHERFEKIYGIAMAIAGVGVVLASLPLIFPARFQANITLQNDVTVVVKLKNYNAVNFDMPLTNTSLWDVNSFLHQVCPYDDLAAKFSVKYPGWQSAPVETILNFINQTLPVTFIPAKDGLPNMVSTNISPACPDSDILKQWAYSVSGYGNDCPRFTSTRSISVFVSEYWSNLSIWVAMLLFFSSSTAQMGYWILQNYVFPEETLDSKLVPDDSTAAPSPPKAPRRGSFFHNDNSSSIERVSLLNNEEKATVQSDEMPGDNENLSFDGPR